MSEPKDGGPTFRLRAAHLAAALSDAPLRYGGPYRRLFPYRYDVGTRVGTVRRFVRAFVGIFSVVLPMGLIFVGAMALIISGADQQSYLKFALGLVLLLADGCIPAALAAQEGE